MGGAANHQRINRKQYRAFGLNIRSEIPLNIASIDEGDWDVDVYLDVLPGKWLEDPRARTGYVVEEDQTIWFVWSELGVMKIHAGNQIVLDPVRDLQTMKVHQAIQSAGLGLLLHQRGVLTLHASAVAIEDGIVAFVGYKGAGKSTTAASLFAKGFPLVTDDLLVLDVDPASGEVYGYPGIPRLRLWPDAVSASLNEDPDQLPRNSAASEKRLRKAGSQFIASKMPLRAIYVLDFLAGPEETLSIQDIAPREACIELTRHSYALHYLGNQGVNTGHFSRTSALAAHTPIRKLYRHRSLQAIPEMVAALLADVSESATLV